MAAKKTSAKATQAKKTASKKTIAKKPEPAKKAVSAKKPAASAGRKAAPPTKGSAKAAAKTRASQTSSVTQSKPAKNLASSEAIVKTVQNEESAQLTQEEALAAAPEPKASIPAANPAVRLPPDADTSDSDEDEGPSSSLLAGPRNVKPYIPRRGEQYMSKEQLEHFRQILLNWKRDLMEEVDRTVSHMKDEAANFPDPNDRATQEEEFSIELRTRDRERKLIRKIDEALKRIEDGTYGYCLETGEEIGIKRLEARPVATLCLEAQERRERRERQYGDRDDRYR